MSKGTVYDCAYRGDFNQVKVHMDDDGDIVKKPDSDGRLLIHWAALSGNADLVEYLLDHKSPVDPRDETDVTPLILGASANRLDVVRLLIGRGADVNSKTNRGQSALLYACSKGFREVAEFLISAGADVNMKDILGATPLHRAAAQGRVNIVEFLLSINDINVNACDKTGFTALHMACEEDRETIVLMLVKAGADLLIQNCEKKTPFDLCTPKIKKLLQNI